MKRTSSLILVTILYLLLSIVKISGQVAVGHVYAEVIESASTESYSINAFEFNPITARDSKFLQQTNLNTTNVNLGSYTIQQQGSNITCNVVIELASFTDTAEKSYATPNAVIKPSIEIALPSNGSPNFPINGKSNFPGIQTSSSYQGFYNVVFAYN